jgi:hypothetical protein
MNNHAFKKTVVAEATCDTNGEIDCLCDYCGLHTTETIPATGHKMVQLSADVSRCEICGKENVNVTEKTTTETTTTKIDTMVQQFIQLGFTQAEAEKMKDIFSTVGITEISNIKAVGDNGIDNLQTYKCDIYDYRADKGGISLHFTIDKRQLCFISLNGIPTTKTNYYYINIFGNVKAKTSNSTKSVTLYDIWDENGEIDNSAIGYQAVFDYENSKITKYEQ